MKKVVIVSACRTAVGTFGGSLVGFPIHHLGGAVIEDVIKRTGVEPGIINEVIFGNVNSPAILLNVGREAALKAGLPMEVPGFTVNRQCGSSLQAINLAYMMICADQADVVLAGGVENMSDYPYSLYNARWGLKYGDSRLVDDAAATLRNEELGITSGLAAELVAEKYSVSREEQDQYALESQQKAAIAIKNGVFNEEIVSLPIRKGTKVFAIDEHPKPGTTMESLAKLKPAFKKDGTVTAGNSCGMNDGAAAVLLMSEDKARELGMKPMASIVSFAVGGVEPAFFPEGPIPAVTFALKRAGLTIDDMDLIECNEAFAAQILADEKALKWERQRLNVNGGAIALGHPLGATGAKLTTTLVYEMKRRKSTYGLVTLCTGGGMGIATILKGES